MKYAFILGREWKLSLAELIHIFGENALMDFSRDFAIFELSHLEAEILQNIGGTTRIIQILDETSPETFATDVIAEIEKNEKNSKIHFALATFGTHFPLADTGMRMKKTLAKNFSVRFLNAKNENIHSAVFKREKLAKSWWEFSLLKLQTEETEAKFWLGKTIACQDIDAYSRRDTSKNRDMIVGMMPPKLVQIMINVAKNHEEISEKNSDQFSKNKKFEAEKNFWKEFTKVKDWKKSPSNEEVCSFSKISVYDPFCGLGTTLIEALNMGIKNVFGSDISAEMVQNSTKSVQEFIKEEKMWQERIKNAWGKPKKDFSDVKTEIFELDAKNIEKSFLEKKIPKNATIISEGFLGKIMKKYEMTQDVVLSEKRSISRLYEAFFESLKNAKFDGTIVMSFPFWKVQNVYIFVENLAEILDKNGFKIENLLPREMGLNTKNGSLLYRRESQNVGREIVKIVKK